MKICITIAHPVSFNHHFWVRVRSLLMPAACPHLNNCAKTTNLDDEACTDCNRTLHPDRILLSLEYYVLKGIWILRNQLIKYYHYQYRKTNRTIAVQPQRNTSHRHWLTKIILLSSSVYKNTEFYRVDTDICMSVRVENNCKKKVYIQYIYSYVHVGEGENTTTITRTSSQKRDH